MRGRRVPGRRWGKEQSLGELRVLRNGERARETQEKPTGIRTPQAALKDPEADGEGSHCSIFPMHKARSFNPCLALSNRPSEVRRSAPSTLAAVPALPAIGAPCGERKHVQPPEVGGARGVVTCSLEDSLPRLLLPRVLAPDWIGVSWSLLSAPPYAQVPRTSPQGQLPDQGHSHPCSPVHLFTQFLLLPD